MSMSPDEKVTYYETVLQLDNKVGWVIWGHEQLIQSSFEIVIVESTLKSLIALM